MDVGSMMIPDLNTLATTMNTSSTRFKLLADALRSFFCFFVAALITHHITFGMMGVVAK